MAAKKKNEDEALLRAIRKRLLSEIQRKDAQAALVNNVYGGSASASMPQGSGVMGQMGQGKGDHEIDPGMFDYYVDIAKTAQRDPDTGKEIGWDKKVHRYRTPKEEGGGATPPYMPKKKVKT